LVLTTPFSLKEEDVSGFESYLHDIIGFFIVEHTISSTTDGFRPRASVDALWDVAANKLYEVVVMALQNCENPDHYLKIKVNLNRMNKLSETRSAYMCRN
jgi:hypothetical protein